MSRKPWEVVFLLDVGPTMHPHLGAAARATADYLMGKMLYKATDEVALTLYGTTGTCNAVHQEMAQAGQAGYEHITEAHPLGPPDVAYLDTLLKLEPGQGQSDWFDALAVAAAALAQHDLKTAQKRVVLLSNFCSQVDVALEDASDLALRLQGMGVVLEVVRLEVPEDVEHTEAKLQNANLLAAVCQELTCEEREVRSAAALMGAWRAHEVSVTPAYSGPLTLHSTCAILVKVTGKTKAEPFPSAGKETEEQVDRPEGMESGLKRGREYHYVDQDANLPEGAVPEEEVIDAFKYGADLVPVPDEEKGDFSFPRDRGMLLVGFVEQGFIPRHYYMADTKLVVADKASSSSGVAMAALVEGMARQRRQAILRFVATVVARPVLMIASPVPASGGAPPHLLMNLLPFMEDVRDYQFPSFSKKQWRPSADQLDAARALVAAMSLGEGPLHEQLRPDDTPNPMIHRLYWHLGRKAVAEEEMGEDGEGTELEAEDPLMKHVFEPHWDVLPGALEAAQAAADRFPMNQAAKASWRSRRLVRKESPAEDFRAAMQEVSTVEEVEQALEELGEAIIDMVAREIGERGWDLAADLADDDLRAQCAVHEKPGIFEAFLRALHAKIHGDPVKAGFLRKLRARGIKPLAEADLAAPGEGGTATQHNTQALAAALAWWEAASQPA